MSKPRKYRSDRVFGAQRRVTCRFELCRMVAKGTRLLHHNNQRVSETMNQVLEILRAPAKGANA
jgi:hypothetical protein